MDLTNDNSTRRYSCVLFGTLDIDGEGEYYCYLKQGSNINTWVLTTKDVTKVTTSQEKQDCIVAVLKTHLNKVTGYGKTYLLTYLLSAFSTMVYMCVNHAKQDIGFLNKAEYSHPTGGFIRYSTFSGGRTYESIELNYEGYKLNLAKFSGSIPVSIPKLSAVEDKKTDVAIISNLGIKTAAMLFKRMGDRLNWYKNKKYTLIDTVEKFRQMMLEFLKAVQKASTDKKSVLVGLDTETTGLSMYNLSPDNPLADHIVAIPFAWEDDKAFLICTDMYYFSNIDASEIYPLFTKLFSRNDDYSYQDIIIEYCGDHFEFSRSNITVGGFNVMFDEMAFFCHQCDVFFDEDGRQLFFNLDTDFVQGTEFIKGSGEAPPISNSLKSQTRRKFHEETLELEELFGKGNEDKFKYLQDPTLALIYGGADADYTRKVIKYAIGMTEPALYRQYRVYDMTLIYRLAVAAWNGMPIDTEAVRKQGDLVKQDLDNLKDFIYHYAWLANRDTIKTKVEQLTASLGADSVEDVNKLLDSDQMFRYPFKPNNHKVLLYDLLHYPVLKRSAKSGEPALDKYVLKKLMSHKRKEKVEVLTQSLRSLHNPEELLVDKEDFNSDAYPLARVFSTYAALNKEYTSYYKPIMEHNLEGHAFYSFTMARAATRRILSPGQTMKGSLKTLVIAPPGQIFMSFDASQIEYRHMASLAYIRTKKILQRAFPDDWERRLEETSIRRTYLMMQKEESDYHIETAAMMTGVRQHQVTHKVRKQYKKIGFGIPYGLGDRSMCEDIFGEINDETMKLTKALLADYKSKQKEIIDLLESTRDSAFVPAEISDEFKEYLGVDKTYVGLVRNFTGFYRLFILENLTRKRVGRIRRQAGNCIIQGGAAELFRRMLYNFWVGCVKVGIHKKVHWLMTVHDELDATVDEDIDIVLLIKVLYECCTLRYKDHIPYYIGINFGANWYDAKSDANELPVIMVQRMIAAYDAGKFSVPSDGNQANNLLILKRHYMCDRIKEELLKIKPDLIPGYVWTEEDRELIDDKFENYVVRSYLEVFSKSDDLIARLNGWQAARDEYGFDNDFLSHKLVDAREVVEDFDFELDNISLDDMTIDLMDDSDDSSSGGESWFGEDSLFDHSLSSDDIIVSDGDDHYSLPDNDFNDDDDLIENPNPTSSFDVFVSKKYVRTKVLRLQDNKYSALTSATSYSGKEKELKSQITSHFTPGSGTIIIIGASVVVVSGIQCSEEELNWLDKLLCEVR